jgi:tagatose 6-phosphate kinase
MMLSICPNPSVDIFVWMDAINAGKVNRAKKEQHFPGGKGVHVALACAELGEEVTLMGFWGGPTGDWIRKECSRYNIRSIGVEVPEWSRTCQSFKSENEYDETEILGVGPEVTGDRQHELEELLEQFLPYVSYVSMSGSWPEGASHSSYARLINICKKHEKPVFLDCSGEQLQYALQEKPYAIHMNATEAGDIFGDMEPEKLAEALGGHCSLAAVTAGKEGLYLTDRTHSVHGKVIVDQCFSAVGSGDCLVAGLLAASLKQMDLDDTARLGVACGAANCLRKDLGMLYKKDVDRLFSQVIIEHC